MVYWGRVYKNTDDIEDAQLVYEIFDYIIDHYCLWSFQLIEEFGALDVGVEEFIKSKEELSQFVKFITNFIPTLVQVRLSDSIGHSNMEKVVNQRLKESVTDSRNNQFKIFIYIFLLLDLDFHRYKHEFPKYSKLITIPIIQYSFILKLNYYLGFRSDLSKEDRVLLKRYIQHQHLAHTDEKDTKVIQKELSKKK